jgi:hypothetical protein
VLVSFDSCRTSWKNQTRAFHDLDCSIPTVEPVVNRECFGVAKKGIDAITQLCRAAATMPVHEKESPFYAPVLARGRIALVQPQLPLRNSAAAIEEVFPRVVPQRVFIG